MGPVAVTTRTLGTMFSLCAESTIDSRCSRSTMIMIPIACSWTYRVSLFLGST